MNQPPLWQPSDILTAETEGDADTPKRRGRIPQSAWPRILEMYKSGATLTAIAREFDCTPSAISYIVRKAEGGAAEGGDQPALDVAAPAPEAAPPAPAPRAEIQPAPQPAPQPEPAQPVEARAPREPREGREPREAREPRQDRAPREGGRSHGERQGGERQGGEFQPREPREPRPFEEGGRPQGGDRQPREFRGDRRDGQGAERMGGERMGGQPRMDRNERQGGPREGGERQGGERRTLTGAAVASMAQDRSAPPVIGNGQQPRPAPQPVDREPGFERNGPPGSEYPYRQRQTNIARQEAAEVPTEPADVRMDAAAKACADAYRAWKGGGEGAGMQTLADSLHELRRVLARMEIEMSASRREEHAARPIPIPGHRAQTRR